MVIRRDIGAQAQTHPCSPGCASLTQRERGEIMPHRLLGLSPSRSGSPDTSSPIRLMSIPSHEAARRRDRHTEVPRRRRARRCLSAKHCFARRASFGHGVLPKPRFLPKAALGRAGCDACIARVATDGHPGALRAAGTAQLEARTQRSILLRENPLQSSVGPAACHDSHGR